MLVAMLSTFSVLMVDNLKSYMNQDLFTSSIGAKPLKGVLEQIMPSYITLTKESLTVWALYAYFSDSQNAAFELLVWFM